MSAAKSGPAADLVGERRIPTAFRAPHPAAATDEATFASTVSKDELPPGYAEPPDTFVKHTTGEAAARAEYLALQALAACGPEPFAPRPRFYGNRTVGMQLLRGARAFECINMLRALSSNGEVPPDSPTRLMDRLLARLTVSQPLIAAQAGRWPTSPYPFDAKVRQLLGLLASQLQLPPTDAVYARQLTQMEHEWNEAVSVPFMDRSLKNIIVVDPRLSPGQHDDATRVRLLRDIVNSEPSWLANVPIRDVDFASVGHLTTLEDDWVSLQLHEATADMYPMLDAVALPPAADRGRRLGLTLVMRYLRFGGRKMAYALMHPAAFAVRFAGHDAGLYFRRLPSLVAQADEALLKDYEPVFERVEEISAAFEALPPLAAEPDPWVGQRHLWRESPLEAGQSAWNPGRRGAGREGASAGGVASVGGGHG
jgi:hypothetical protein